MIRSAKLSNKYANLNKHSDYILFNNEYNNVAQQFIDILWNMNDIPSLLPKEITEQIQNTWLSQRAIQCIGKQVSSIIRGTRKKQKQRIYKLKQLQKESELPPD
jgi:hypothetical protein